MKFLFIASINLAMVIQASATTSVEDLKFNCSGEAKVTQASELKYDPGLPPSGRFPGTPASSSMNLKIEFISKSEDCSILENKYNYDLQEMEILADVSPAIQNTVISQGSIVGKVLEFNITQHYKYMTNKKFLPFYPDLIEETLYISTLPISVSGYNVSSSKKIEEIDTHQAHGSQPVNQKSDAEKMDLAERVLNSSQYSGYNKMFGNTLLELEPDSKHLKSDYAKLLWGYLHQLKFNNKAPYGFFSLM